MKSTFRSSKASIRFRVRVRISMISIMFKVRVTLMVRVKVRFRFMVKFRLRVGLRFKLMAEVDVKVRFMVRGITTFPTGSSMGSSGSRRSITMITYRARVTTLVRRGHHINRVEES